MGTGLAARRLAGSAGPVRACGTGREGLEKARSGDLPPLPSVGRCAAPGSGCPGRSEEHTSELQSRRDLVCRLLLEKKKRDKVRDHPIKKEKEKKTKTTPVVKV